MAKGGLEEGSEEWIDMQDKIRAAEEAVLDNKIAIEQYREELKQLSVDAFDLVRNAFSNKDTFLTNQQDYIQGYADLLEAQGIDVPAELYEELIAVEQDKRANNVSNLVDARTGLAKIEAAGYTAADEEWQNAYQKVVELEKAVQDNDTAMAQYEKTIRDMDLEKFDRFIDRLDDIHSEIDNIRGLFDDDDVAFEDGTWTKEGLTSLGLAYQQMELAKQKSQEYAEKIDDLNEAYDNGEMSEQEYYERLQDLKDGQWSAIDAYESAKDAIVDMEEARIDMIEKGINEEIEAYQELIDVKKEELDAERDLYEFKKNIEKQTKDIGALERRIASLSGSTEASDIAERRKLEAELIEARAGLDDTYYSHAKDQQGQALDDELESYQEAKDNYLETLRDALEDTETIINEKITEVLSNADVVLNGLNTTAGEYGVTLSGSLTQPWIDASATATAFKTNLDTNLSLLTNESGVVTLFNVDAKQKLEEVFSAGGVAATGFKTSVETEVGNVKKVVSNSTSELTSNLKFPWKQLTSDDSPINTFSNNAKTAIAGAITSAQDKASAMTNALTSPWRVGKNAMNTFSEHVKEILDKAQREAAAAGAQISKSLNVTPPSYTGGVGDNTNDNPADTTTVDPPKKNSADVKALQEILNDVFYANIKVDGIYSQATKNAVAAAQKRMGIGSDGWYGAGTRSAMVKYIDNLIKLTLKEGQNTTKYKNAKQKLPVAMYASGTMGTKKDEWAITDESWIGEEITLAAGKNGQLQYLKKGSAVMPADISANLVEWGKMNPNMLDMSGAVQGVNLMSNYVNKPELNLDFENLIRIDTCTEETLPAVKKLVQQEIDSFARKLNYSLKKFAY
jgi:hypothetical protein